MDSTEDPRLEELDRRIKALTDVVLSQAELIGKQHEILNIQEQLLDALEAASKVSGLDDTLTIGRIYECTRVLGASQGYLGLPVHDDAYPNVEGQPAIPYMDSCWEFNEEQRAAIAAGAPLILRLLGERDEHPPVQLILGQRVVLN
jgi:hypothetical protein